MIHSSKLEPDMSYYPFQVRKDVFTSFRLPTYLDEQEAERIVAFIRSLVIPKEFKKKGE